MAGAGLYATIMAVLTAIALGYLVYVDSPMFWFVFLVGGFVSGFLYGLAFRFKGLLLSILIAILFGLSIFVGIAARPFTPVGGWGFLLAGLRFIAVPIVGVGGLIISLSGGVIGALISRRRFRL